jgi:hypothetical protein
MTSIDTKLSRKMRQIQFIKEFDRSMNREKINDWQSITTAPQDGTEILAYGTYYDFVLDKPSKRPHMNIVRFADTDEFDGWVDRDDCDFLPTHWQPLPQPPEGT